MSNDMNEYIKELKQLKSLNLLPPEELEELDKLITMMESSDVLGLTQESDYSNYKLPIKFVNTSKNPDPNYAKEGDSGMDLRAELTEVGGKYVMKPFERALIPTGLYFELPNGYELQIRPRSGLALKYGVTVLNSPGTIDSDYREEIGVILINHGNKGFEIKKGDRIAQLVICKIEQCEIEKVESKEALGETDRKGGFGSTGVW